MTPSLSCTTCGPDHDDTDDTKLIGVHRSEAAAAAAIARLRNKPGFSREHPAGFEISAYRLDRDHWEEGFVGVAGEENSRQPAVPYSRLSSRQSSSSCSRLV